MSEQYKTAAKNMIEKGFNQKDQAAFEAYFSLRLIDHALPAGMPVGLEGRKLFYSAFLAAFPDLHVHIEDTFAEDDKLVTCWVSTRHAHWGIIGHPAYGKESFYWRHCYRPLRGRSIGRANEAFNKGNLAATFISSDRNNGLNWH